MKQLYIIGVFIIQTLFVSGQSNILTDDDYNNSGAIKLRFADVKTKAIELAKLDIERGVPFIFLKSGIDPVIYSTDSVFEKKYKVYYYEQGCVSPDNELMIAYNDVIFKHLTDTYGTKWRKEVRKDAIGFRRWKCYRSVR